MKKCKQALSEAIDALGDIPAESSTKQQKQAYELCVEARAELSCPRDRDAQVRSLTKYSGWLGVALLVHTAFLVRGIQPEGGTTLQAIFSWQFFNVISSLGLAFFAMLMTIESES